jgi:nitrous oxidase accessory protein
MFGITAEKSNHARIAFNEIEGERGEAMGLRGDAIRLWETRDSVVQGNRVQDGRDVVVWYSPRNRVEGNRIRGGRYGTHFMYSSDCVVAGNTYDGNVVGIFAMYSRNIVVERNRILNASGAAGIGLGVKESGNLTVRNNHFVHDTTGLYLDTSPLYDDDHNRFEHNELAFCDSAVLFHASRPRNAFHDNRLRENATQVVVEGGGDALTDEWEGNQFDDYAGYDLDGDGFGDVPYQLRSLSGELTAQYPDLTFLRGLPALSLTDAVGHLVPLYQPRTVLVDPKPRLRGGGVEEAHAG